MLQRTNVSKMIITYIYLRALLLKKCTLDKRIKSNYDKNILFILVVFGTIHCMLKFCGQNKTFYKQTLCLLVCGRQ